MESVSAVDISGRGYKYEAIVGLGLLDRVGTLIRDNTPLVRSDRLKRSSPTDAENRAEPCDCALITDDRVAPLFGAQAMKSLTAAGLRPKLITIAAGENSKTLEQVGAICDQMLEARLDRQSFVIGLGGGVIGDISGFVAAIFQRGIPHVQVPTTLLAMVDSSIGGKTGVNARAGKNLLGTVHQPSLVIDDVDLLHNLPTRELHSGFAEIIKHAIIADAKMFQALPEFAAAKPDGLKQSSLQQLVCRNVEIKAGIVAKDEQDRTGGRALLNFGHTIGHGIERAGEYKTFTHGEAISLGMVAAAKISMRRAGLSETDCQAIVDLLTRFELPTRLPTKFPRDQIIDALQFDKKFEGGAIRFVVTPQIGSARLTSEVTLEDIREAIAKL